MEVWRPIAGIPDYMVSSFGRVRSHKRGKVTILNPPHDKGGVIVMLCYVLMVKR